MFKIKSQIEILLESDQDVRRTGYHPTAGSYTCPDCKEVKNETEFFNYHDTEAAIETLITQKHIDLNEIPVFREHHWVAFARKFSRDCSTCQFPIDAEIVFFLQESSPGHWSIECEICDSSSLEYRFPSFLSLGIDIYCILPSLFLRWWKRKCSIDLVVPFIKPNFLELFAYVGKYTSGYEFSISDGKQKLDKNPFRDVIFRKVQERYRRKETTLKDVVRQFYVNVQEQHGEDYFCLNPDGLGVVLPSFRQVINEVKEYNDENLGLKYSGNFHAKFIAGVGAGTTELYLMSYNFGEIESLQFETHFLTVVDTAKYNQEMAIFKKYHRLKMEDFK